MDSTRVRQTTLMKYFFETNTCISDLCAKVCASCAHQSKPSGSQGLSFLFCLPPFRRHLSLLFFVGSVIIRVCIYFFTPFCNLRGTKNHLICISKQRRQFQRIRKIESKKACFYLVEEWRLFLLHLRLRRSQPVILKMTQTTT